MLTSFVYKCHVRQYFHTFLKSFHFFNSFDFYFHQFLQTVKKISSFLLLIVLFCSLLGLLRYPIGPWVVVSTELIGQLKTNIGLTKIWVVTYPNILVQNCKTTFHLDQRAKIVDFICTFYSIHKITNFEWLVPFPLTFLVIVNHFRVSLTCL